MQIKKANSKERGTRMTPPLVGRVSPCARSGLLEKCVRSNGKIVLLFAFCLAFCAAIAADEKQPNSTIKRFRSPLEYFDPPHELQVKTLLEGAEAVPGTNGSILIHEAILQTFHADGSWEMTAKAPQCFWDSHLQTVSSTGPLQVLTADEKNLFHHQGVGFSWLQTNSDLFISNNVSTTITPLTNSPTR